MHIFSYLKYRSYPTKLPVEMVIRDQSIFGISDDNDDFWFGDFQLFSKEVAVKMGFHKSWSSHLFNMFNLWWVSGPLEVNKGKPFIECLLFGTFNVSICVN